MKERYPGARIELVKGDGGVFDVRCDGRLIYSRRAEGQRFPRDGEVSALIRDKMA